VIAVGLTAATNLQCCNSFKMSPVLSLLVVN